jgi:hypothetical protein
MQEGSTIGYLPSRGTACRVCLMHARNADSTDGAEEEENVDSTSEAARGG